MHSIGSIVVIESVDAVAPLCVRTEALVGELDVDAAGMSIVAYITSSIATSNLAGLIDERGATSMRTVMVSLLKSQSVCTSAEP
jgi:hypothetical protein